MITFEARRRPMPRQALLVSVFCLWVPVVRDKAGTHFDPTVLEAFDPALGSGAMQDAMNVEVVERSDRR